ncbi:MAG: hypothetical protein ABFC89_08715 [Methanospirillum sp.]
MALIPAALRLPPSVTVAVRNVVAVARVADHLRVEDLAPRIPGATLELRLLKMVVHFARPRATVLAFGSGKVVFTGLQETDDLVPAFAALLEALRAAGADLADPVPLPRIVNVVASGTLGDGVALHHLALSRNFDRVEFDPEQFPGLVYRSRAGPVALVFGTGSYVITGARSIDGAMAIASEVRAMVTAADAWTP